jgi:hypothetical protein
VSGTIGDGPSSPENSGLQHWRYDDAESVYSIANPPVVPGPSRWGFGFHLSQTVAGGWLRGGYPIISVFAPHWFVVILFGVLPLLNVRRRLTRGRLLRHGLCQACGYDLRATLDRCPECGTAKPTRESAAA